MQHQTNPKTNVYVITNGGTPRVDSSSPQMNPQLQRYMEARSNEPLPSLVEARSSDTNSPRRSSVKVRSDETQTNPITRSLLIPVGWGVGELCHGHLVLHGSRAPTKSVARRRKSNDGVLQGTVGMRCKAHGRRA